MKKSSLKPVEKMPFRRGRGTIPLRSFPGPGSRMEWVTPQICEVLAAGGTDAHRLASGPQAWLERFGPDLLFSYRTEQARAAILAEFDARCSVLGYASARIFGRHLPQQAAERSAPVLWRGDATGPMETEVLENGVRYGLDFAGGYSVGLFIDQRTNRARIRELKPRRLLNTFAYTCSFSVVAALAGAETVSVDLSRRSLNRGKENFQRNGLAPETGHRFLAEDVLDLLPRLARRGEKFDAIILDPPTFSRNQTGAAFQVQRDFERLVTLALEVAAPGASLLLSVNHSAMRVADLERAARSSVRGRNRTGRFLGMAPLPDFPPGEGARTLWLQLS